MGRLQRVLAWCEAVALALADRLRAAAAWLARAVLPVAVRVAAWRRRWVAAVAVTGLACAVMRSELDRLVASELSPDGTTASLRAVLGPSALGQTGAWDTWHALGAAGAFDVGSWVVAQALLTAVVAVALGVVLLRLLGTAPVGRGLVAALVLAQLVQSGAALVLGGLLADHRPVGPGAGLLALVSFIVWLLFGALVVCVVGSRSLRAAVGARLRLLGTAVRYQRLSVVVVVLLGLASTASGPNILDQIPDVERAWVNGGRGLRDAAVGVLTVLAVSLVLLAIGRRRAERARATYASEAGVAGVDPTPGRWLVWLLGPALALAGAAALAARGVPDTVSAVVLPLFVGLPVLVVVVSGLLRRAPWLWVEPSPPAAPAVAEVTRGLGDGLAVGMLTVLGLGVVRSYTAPVFSHLVVERELADLLVTVAVLASGLAIVALSLPGGLWLVERLDPPPTTPQPGLRAMLLTPGPDLEAAPAWVRRVPAAVCVLTPGLLVWALVDPVGMSGAFGVFGLVTAVLGAWVVVLGSLVVYLQDCRPLPVFRMMHLRASPVLTLFVAVPALATFAPSEPELHHVRTFAEQTASPSRPSLAERFDSWLTAGEDCAVPVGDGSVRVRPLLVVAASGGGIRSAYWTASVMQRLQEAGPCGSRTALLSSGVSGGAVGLVVARQAGPDGPVAAVRRMSRPGALAAGLSGTLVGDLVAGSVGLRVPPVRGGDDPARWLDRAGLMERRWQHSVPALAEEWSSSVAGPGGAIVLNSTDARLGCRVLVSQVRLELGGGDGGLSGVDRAANCRARTGQPAGSLDLFTAFAECSPRVDWSTAAMLAARFPTVTPAGRVPRRGACEHATPDLQLVDGGYAESSGVGTLAELAPQLAALVRDHNAGVRAGGAYVVPAVAYLEDEVRSDVVARAPGQAPELFVPLAGRKAKAMLSVTASQLQRVARAFADPCAGRDDGPCDVAVRAVHEGIPDAALLVGPSLEASVTAPLGWTLSQDSVDQLDRALGREACRTGARPGAYATLGALLRLLGDQGLDRCPH